MLNLNKKQVGALLKIMSKDDSRPVLCSAKVDTFDDKTVLAFTDGYQLTALYLDAEDATEILGKMVRRSAIEKWYKLATGKSRLTTQELVTVFADDYGQHGSYLEGNYPEWQGLVPQGITEPQEKMSFNAEFFKNVQDLYDSEGLTVKLYGILAPMVVDVEQGMSLVMPRKK